MKIFGYTFFEKLKAEQLPDFQHTPPPPPQMEANWGGGYYRSVFSTSFDGEKNLGELGPIRNYFIDYAALRMRSWQLYLDSEVCQTVIRRFARWVIGGGLKLQAEPMEGVLESEQIKFDVQGFDRSTESRFKVYANSTRSDYAGMKNLHEQAYNAFINSKIGGDCLVVLRYVKGVVTTQLIDAAHLCNPMGMPTMAGYAMYNGNRVRDGVEINEHGEQVAFHVRTKLFTTERIPAKVGKYGIIQAFLVNGLSYRLDDTRSLPLLCAVMESAAKLERYKEATLGSAEEIAKITLAIEHELGGKETHPFLDKVARTSGVGNNTGIPRTIEGEELSNKVIATTNKQTVNLPAGAKLTTVEGKGTIQFKDFYTVNIDIICACVGIPPNVAMMLYDGNFSASRAALKDWEHTLMVERKNFASFYQNVYNFWLYTEILSNKIQAPGYLEAIMTGNYMAVEAYQSARWVGANVPHIDPEKEVRAERLKLGDLGANIPLTTAEAATEALNGGDFKANLTQYAEELEETEEAGIEPSRDPAPVSVNNGDVPD